MYLKAIELENFKTFVHKNRIEFKPGFTAISGPNGSGKSNLGDAILFVLGPKSSKVIRANRLTDLIYDGGKTGKKADFCRVSLIFDNSDRVLPIDSNEVKLTRYVRRNGEDGYVSYFYINDEKARLQDFASLLENAKIDADGYNFVRQGDITRIVKMSPVERRQILEDIAGISEFDRDIAKAEEKRKALEENMEKIELLMDEIKTRVEELRNDRETALRYRALEEELKETRAKIAYAMMMEAKENMDSYTREIDEYQKKIAELEREIAEKNKELESLRVKHEEVERKLREAGGEELSNLNSRINELKIEVARLRSRIEDREDAIKENESRIASLKKELKSLRSELEAKKNERENISRRLNEKQALLRERENELSALEQENENANRQFHELREKLKDVEGKIEGSRKIYNDKIVELNRVQEKLGTILRDIARLEEEKKEVEEGIKDAEWRIKSVKSRVKESEGRRKELNEKYMRLKNAHTRLQKELATKEREIEALNEEYHRLKGKMESSDPLSMAVNAILTARDTGELDGIYGTISELGTVDEKYELAIQIAAGNRLMSIVCENDEAAARAIEYLKKNRLGRAIFLPLNKMLAGRPRGRAIVAARDKSSHGFAIDLIKFDRKFEAAFWYVFGDTVIVNDLNSARKLMGGVRMVTLDGQLIEASGAMVGGSVERRRKIAMGNINEIATKLRNARAERDSIQMELKELAREMENVLKEMSTIGSTSTEDMVAWEREKARLKEKLAIIERDIRRKNEEKKGLENIKDSLNRETAVLSKEIDALESKREEIQNLLDKSVSDEHTKKMQELRHEIGRIREAIASTEKSLRELESGISALEMEIRNKEMRIRELKESNEQMREENERHEQEIERMMTERRKYEEIVKREEAHIKELMDEIHRLQSSISDIEKALVQMESQKRTKEELIISMRAKMKDAEDRYLEARRVYESYGIEVNAAESLRSLRRKQTELDIKIKSLGDVNLKSIEEFERESERLESLKEDYQELSDEKREIEKLVKELNIKKKDGLLKVFRAINENMKRIYSELTDGGEALLVLENEKDPFKGGLEIKVKLPGKGLKRLEALSGGEKSLTALAFIFAIQQYEPSPIYLLDEVDMFLDGVNAEVVGRMIKRNSASAQFIVISLRKATLKFAEHIIGVTHRGDGISHIYMQPVMGEVSENA